ncbi:xanthine dehydrogenase small subunit [Phormidium tenue FACHB-886]|nr:xanthine dehydrogenase small subunit [Phormidium tenue FACHB-886]
MTQGLQNSLNFTINGEAVHLKNISPTQTLLQYLQQNHCTGTKEGCGDGDCGACTVTLMAQNAEGRPHYQAINSCLVPLAALAGREVITVEGLGQTRQSEELHPVQTAMIQTGGSQCGYCTPGFIMSMFAAYYDGKVDDAAVEGNLCRCTGYLSIRRAAQLLTQSISSEVSVDPNQQDLFAKKLNECCSTLDRLSYSGNQQQFYRPTQLSEVLELLEQHPDAVLVAGATDLGLEMSHHRQSFPVMVSLEAVAQLKQIEQTSESVTIGAGISLSQIETDLHGIFPSLDQMLYYFAARQIRNRATLGGNIGTASPIGDLPPVLLSLDAELHLVSKSGERFLPLADFFKGYRQTALQPGEVIVSVRIPKAQNITRHLSQAYKVGKRGTDDISIVSAAFAIELDQNNQILQARLAYGGVAAIPARAIAVEQLLIGQPWSIETVQQVKPVLREFFTPLTDVRGSADYRRQLVANLFEKFFVEAQVN